MTVLRHWEWDLRELGNEINNPHPPPATPGPSKINLLVLTGGGVAEWSDNRGPEFKPKRVTITICIFLNQELQISKEDARLFVLFAVPKAVTQAGIAIVQGQVEIIKVLPHLTTISGAMKLGAPFSQAVRLSGTVFTGAKTSVGVARVGTAFAVTTATKVLGGLGAVIGIADAVYSWNTKNPNRASAEELLPQLKSNLESPKKTKKEFLQLKEQIDN